MSVLVVVVLLVLLLLLRLLMGSLLPVNQAVQQLVTLRALQRPQGWVQGMGLGVPAAACTWSCHLMNLCRLYLAYPLPYLQLHGQQVLRLPHPSCYGDQVQGRPLPGLACTLAGQVMCRQAQASTGGMTQLNR
jgi:hypothetical protein